MILSSSDIEYKLRPVREALALNESEETWDKIAGAVTVLRMLLQESGGAIPEYFAGALRSLSSPLSKCIGSERSRLSGATMDLLNTAATELGKSFEILLSVFVPTLIVLCGRPNKVFVTRAKACLITIIQSTQSPLILSYLLRSAKDKSTPLRLTVAEASLACLQCFNPPDLQKDSRGQEVEALVKCFATDANADIRKVGRNIFEAYSILLPGRVDRFVAPLTPTIKRYLAVSSRLLANTTRVNPPSRPTSSQSVRSVMGSSHSDTIAPQPCLSRNTGRRPDPAPSTSKTYVVEVTETTLSSLSTGTGREQAPSAPKRPESTLDARTMNDDDMPPPTVVPSRPRRDGALRVHDLGAVASSSQAPSSSNASRPRTGPMRPEALLPGSSLRPVTPQDDQPEQRRAGGARRVLRLDPALSDSQSTRDKTEESRPKLSAPAQSRQRTTSTQSKRPIVRDSAASSNARIVGKAPAPKVSTTAHAENLPGQTIKTVVRQPLRTRTISNVSNTTQRRPADKVTNRTGASAKTHAQSSIKTKLSKTSSTRTAPKQAKPAKGVVPELVPLPRSRSHTPESETEAAQPSPHGDAGLNPLYDEHEVPSNAGSELVVPSKLITPELQYKPVQVETEEVNEAELDEQAVGAEDDGASNVPETPHLDVYPTTPQAKTSHHQRRMIEQTPISALVESIQQGFVFTPTPGGALYTLEEGDSYDGSVEMEKVFPRVEPLPTWECKPLAFSKPSS